ncbi:MAG: acylphosphatase [Dethiosulfatibacter sp.]|nr:acylphosphatase [Dethiosulfatibacter sp.]
MGLKEIIKKMQKDYVIKKVANINMPTFREESIIREHIIFKGRVQKVGFRMEMNLIAQKIGLTGWVRNNDSGTVEAEVQGEKNKIDYLKEQMKSLKRGKITNMEVRELPLKEDEKLFSILDRE